MPPHLEPRGALRLLPFPPWKIEANKHEMA